MGTRPAACTIVAVDPDGAVLELLRAALGEETARVVRVADLAEALRALDEEPAELVVADRRSAASADGEDLTRSVQARWPGMPVLLLSDPGSTDDMAASVGAGASEVLLRPVAPDHLAFAVRTALALSRRGAAAPPPPSSDVEMVFGRSPAMVALRDFLQRVAPTSSTVLVRGESGTGKELVARALHRWSPRAARPFIKIDCTSLPENLIESELFGYEKGAFTGAAGQKIGRVQLADGGTLFLDEIGELTAPTQAKLLRLLQDREFERLGGKSTLRVDVRVVAATHRDLETMVERGTFRQDLFYRLNVVPAWVAPLRARRGDIPELARHFCGQVNAQNAASGRAPVTLGAAALRALSEQRWPGNVRQLQNFVERLVVLCTDREISEEQVRAELARPVRFATETGAAGADAAGAEGADGARPAEESGEAAPGTGEGGAVAPLSEALRAAERQALLRALKHAGGNRSAAARLLGVSRSTLYTKLEEYGLLAGESGKLATPS